MRKFSIYSLKALRKTLATFYRVKNTQCLDSVQDATMASQIIYDTLMTENPCMIVRFGSTELACLSNYLGVKNNNGKYIDYIKGKVQPWWWEENIINQMQQWSGFFPATVEKIEQFCNLMLSDIPLVDVLGFYREEEHYFDDLLGIHAKVNFELLNPYFSKIPWTRALEGKKVLVVHPFAQTIKSQYKKRELLFENNLLPAFELLTIQAVQTIAGIKSDFSDWFEALDYMKQQINKTDYDICLIGCGAYGFPLAAHVKRQGKKAVHLGGSLQLLFGIRGKRWENENYNPTYNFAKLINEYWVKPGDVEKPKGAEEVEDACYW
jgi:hypothetical protein